jgi:hypothetical protein
LESWNTKVDQKAAIVLTLQSASMALIVTLSADGRTLSDLSGGSLLLFRFGAVLLVLATLMSGVVVMPQLASKRAVSIWRDNTIYFGHLKNWDPSDLAKRLESMQPGEFVEQLSRQHVVLSQILWRKHRLLQISMVVAATAILLLFLSGL